MTFSTSPRVKEAARKKKSTGSCQQQVLKKDVRLTPPWKSQHAKRSKSDTDVLPLSGGDQTRCSSSAVQAKQPEKDVYMSDHKLFIFSSDLNRMALIASGCVAKSLMSSRTSREDASPFFSLSLSYKAALLRAFLTLSLPCHDCCHLKTTNESAISNPEEFQVVVFLYFVFCFFVLACEKICVKTHRTENRFVIGAAKYIACRRVRALFSPKIVQGLCSQGVKEQLTEPKTHIGRKK